MCNPISTAEQIVVNKLFNHGIHGTVIYTPAFSGCLFEKFRLLYHTAGTIFQSMNIPQGEPFPVIHGVTTLYTYNCRSGVNCDDTRSDFRSRCFFCVFFGFYGSHIGEMIQSFDEHIFNMAGEHISARYDSDGDSATTSCDIEEVFGFKNLTQKTI